MKEKRVESVERALSVLEAFSAEKTSLSLTEISLETGLYKSAVLRLAASLERFGYLKRGPDLQYRLGPALWRLGALYRRNFDMGESIRPALRQLVEATGETASFYVLDQDERLCLYRENSTNAVRHHLEEGARLTLQNGAAAHVLAAYGLNDEKALMRLSGARFATSQGERNPHISAIAAPLYGPTGQFHGALAISGPRDRFDAAARERAGAVLLEATEKLSSRL